MQNSWQYPSIESLQGETVLLLPLDPTRDAVTLYEISHGTPEREVIWKFLPYGPFADSSQMQTWMQEEMTGKPDPIVFTVFDTHTRRQVGSVALMSINAAHGRAEIGHVWFSPEVHKTKVNTESQYLLLKYLFDFLHYRRVEWKCDSLNHASRTAAARMGFLFEGRFRQHMVIRAKNRDTDWFAMTDKEWPRCKANFEAWLRSSGDTSLTELKQFR
ncbi:MAG: GNAT family N-acetyltransferase [Armatimonadetes bacterium]|nr:GNAT family N-acetyltransferase [Armatimonadota bacterium]